MTESAVAAPAVNETRQPIVLTDMAGRLARYNYFLEPGQAEMLRLVLTSPYFGSDQEPRVRAVRLTGPAGSGKTFLGEVTSKVMSEATGTKHKPYYFQATRNMAEDEMFFGIIPGEAGENFQRYEGVLLDATRKSMEQPVVLVLDEWDKARPQADAMLLDFLQSGRISHPACRVNGQSDNLIVFVCTNDERELSEPLQRRCAALELGHPPVDIMERILRKECPESGYVEHALKVYAQSIKASLSKPATAQELVQMIQALEDSETVTELTFGSILNTFILKTPPDRKLFADWCAKNAKTSLVDMAKDIQSKSSTISAYKPFNPNEENYRAVTITELNDTSSIVTPLRVWSSGFPEKGSARKGHAMFEAAKLTRAVSHIPALTRDPDKWGIVDNTAVSFDPLTNVDGYASIMNLAISPGVTGTVVFTMDCPVSPPAGFSGWSVSKKAEELYVYDPGCSRGFLTAVDRDKRKFRIWFEVRRERLEVIISTDNTFVELNPTLKRLMGEPFMKWWLGEQDETDPYWYSSRNYGDGEPSTHGLFRINMTKLDAATAAELKKRNRVRSLHVKKLIQQKA